jgi:Xaa-Pro aminopeptidase
MDPVREHALEFAGTSIQAKLDKVFEKVSTDFLLVFALDEIAWVLNCRGNDIEYNPVFFAYLILTKEGKKVDLFVNDQKLNEVRGFLEGAGVRIHPYESIGSVLNSLQGTVAVNADECNFSLYNAIGSAVNCPSPIELLKSVKTEREVVGMRSC